MINNIVFPPSVEVRPTFHVVRMKDEVNGNPTRVIVRFTLVKNYLLDSYGNPTVPQYHDPVYIDVMTHRMIEPSTFDFVMAFNPNQISGEINDLQRKAENEKAELEAKIATLDADVKQLSKGFDPRVTKLVEELDTLRKDYDAVVVESQRRFNDCQRFSKLLTEATNTVSDNAKTIKKLQSDAINVAIQRDNEVTTLATEKAKAMLPNIQRERDFFKERVDTLNKELHSARKFVEEAEGVMDDKDINWGRTVRKLEKKLRKAGGRERYWKRQVEIERRDGGRHAEKIDSLKKQVADSQAFAKEQVKTVGKLEEALAKTIIPQIAEIPLGGDKTINVTLNIASMSVNELNNYN